MTKVEEIQRRLHSVFEELNGQTQLAHHFGGETLTFEEEMEQIREYLEDAGEYGIAYEALVANLENVPFVISGKAAIKMLEVGLMLGYKTEDQKDAIYDRRNA